MNPPGAVDCNDNDECTLDKCDPGDGTCTNTDIVCDDGSICTIDDCDPLSGCTYDAESLEGTECSTGQSCWVGESCLNGVCQGGGPDLCDDGDPCTTDICDPSEGCQHPFNSAPCNDENACTDPDVCSEGACLGSPVDCGSSNPCTNVSCDPDIGCVSDFLNGAACDDGVLCTAGDSCLDGLCAGTPFTCDDDDNPCTMVECQNDGCVQVPQSGGTCEDGNICTPEDSCVDGACVGGGVQPPGCYNGDFDHDGIANQSDNCAFAYDPGGSSGACFPAQQAYDMPQSRTVALSLPGATIRRTDEPLELPLRSGIVDESVIGHWPLDDEQAQDQSHYALGGVPEEVESATSLTPGLGGALAFNGNNSGITVPGTEDLGVGPGELTAMVWFWPQQKDAGCLFSKPYQTNSGSSSSHNSFYLQNWNNKLSGYVQVQQGGMISVGLPEAVSVTPQAWHHAAMTYGDGKLRLYLNGRLAKEESSSSPIIAQDTPLPLSIGEAGLPIVFKTYFGRLDDLVLLDRVLTATEIETYYQTQTSFGSPTVPGAQADFDDVRILEEPAGMEPAIPTTKRSRVIGVRPHSDTPCPMAQDDGSWADREDLCGVLAYWKLDGGGADEMGAHPGVNVGASPAHGRFGDEAGTLSFGGSEHITVESVSGLSGMSALTVEAFIRASEPAQTSRFIISNQTNCDGNLGNDAYGLYVGSQGLLYFGGFHVGNPGSSAASVSAVDDGLWHHVAVTYDGAEVRVFVDGVGGAPNPASGAIQQIATPVLIGADNCNGPAMHFNGKIDDLIIHSVAKSPDYIYRRANPGIPKLRFLANTGLAPPGENANPRSYTLHWGDETAEAQLPFVTTGGGEKCYGLLNECFGYRGWWEFNDSADTIAIDSSARGTHGEMLNGAFITGAKDADGTALELDGDDDHALLAGEALSGLFEFTVETRSLADDELTGSEPVIFAAQNAGYGISLLLGAYSALLHVDAGGSSSTTALTNMTDGNWKSLQVGRSPDGNGFIFLDEQEKSQPANWPPTLLDGVDMIFVGARGQPNNQPWVDRLWMGLIDSVRIMNRALEPDEFLHFPRFEWSLGDVQN